MEQTIKNKHPLERAIDDLEDETTRDFEEIVQAGGKWEDIGFHRPLGNFFYGIFISIFTGIIGLVFLNLMVSILYPYPEIQGYNSIAGSLFSLVFMVFDTGTAFGIERFIAEWRVKNPKRMLNYIQFYIWYQMMTGVIQILVISILVLNFMRFQNLAYLSWILLIILQKQWPGMLGIFRSVLGGLQLYNKTQILGLISGQLFQNLTNIIFILLGRWIGIMNPGVGELMGAAIGSAIGVYVDDFFAMWLATYYFKKAMKPFGFSARDCFRIEFDREIIKQCLWFGFQVSVVPMVSISASTAVLFMMIDSIPSLATYKALLGIVNGLIGFIDAGNFSLVPSIAESYMNGKKTLARYYINNSLRWNGFLMMMFTSILIAAMPMILTVILELPGLQYYQTALVFFLPALIHKFFLPFIAYPDSILVGVLKINFYTFSRVFEEIIYLFDNYIYFYVIKIQNFGIPGIVWALAMERFVCRLIKMVIMWIYIHKKVFQVKLNWYQMIICPLICSLPIFLFGFLWKGLAFDPMLEQLSFMGEWGLYITVIVSALLALLIVPIVIFLPLTGFLGGWDDFGLVTLKKAVKLSGPSKPFANLLYRSVLFGAKHSPLHNRFKIEWDKPMQEIKELMIMKRDQVAKLYDGSKVVGATRVIEKDEI